MAGKRKRVTKTRGASNQEKKNRTDLSCDDEAELNKNGRRSSFGAERKE